MVNSFCGAFHETWAMGREGLLGLTIQGADITRSNKRSA